MIEIVLELIEEASPVWLVADCECKNCYYTWVGVLHQNRTAELECDTKNLKNEVTHEASHYLHP